MGIEISRSELADHGLVHGTISSPNRLPSHALILRNAGELRGIADFYLSSDNTLEAITIKSVSESTIQVPRFHVDFTCMESMPKFSVASLLRSDSDSTLEDLVAMIEAVTTNAHAHKGHGPNVTALEISPHPLPVQGTHYQVQAQRLYRKMNLNEWAEGQNHYTDTFERINRENGAVLKLTITTHRAARHHLSLRLALEGHGPDHSLLTPVKGTIDSRTAHQTDAASRFCSQLQERFLSDHSFQIFDFFDLHLAQLGNKKASLAQSQEFTRLVAPQNSSVTTPSGYCVTNYGSTIRWKFNEEKAVIRILSSRDRRSASLSITPTDIENQRDSIELVDTLISDLSAGIWQIFQDGASAQFSLKYLSAATRKTNICTITDQLLNEIEPSSLQEVPISPNYFGPSKRSSYRALFEDTYKGYDWIGYGIPPHQQSDPSVNYSMATAIYFRILGHSCDAIRLVGGTHQPIEITLPTNLFSSARHTREFIRDKLQLFTVDPYSVITSLTSRTALVSPLFGIRITVANQKNIGLLWNLHDLENHSAVKIFDSQPLPQLARSLISPIGNIEISFGSSQNFSLNSRLVDGRIDSVTIQSRPSILRRLFLLDRGLQTEVKLAEDPNFSEPKHCYRILAELRNLASQSLPTHDLDLHEYLGARIAEILSPHTATKRP